MGRHGMVDHSFSGARMTRELDALIRSFGHSDIIVSEFPMDAPLV
jgi:hypothetical protein